MDEYKSPTLGHSASRRGQRMFLFVNSEIERNSRFERKITSIDPTRGLAGSRVIFVIATVELQPETRAQFLAEIARTALEVRQEAGCVEYNATVDVASGSARQPPLRAEVVTIIEKWVDLAALTAHLAAPHMQDFRKRVSALVRGTTLQVLAPAS